MISNREGAIEAIMCNHIVMYEFLKCQVGDLLGEGSFRYVFENPHNRNEVIKFDMSDCNQNTIEFNLWHDIKNEPDLAKWFAPVVKMSPCGRILIMKKATMGKPVGDYPARVPNFFDDVKIQNWGFIDGKPVCVDYAFNKIALIGRNYKLVKAEWL